MNGRLLALVQRFAASAAHSYADPNDAAGGCHAASTWFAGYMADSGYRPVLVKCSERYEVDRFACAHLWRAAHPQDMHHYVVRVGGCVFDWTARQFDRAADFPHIGKMIDLSADWRLVEDAAIYRRGKDGLPVVSYLRHDVELDMARRQLALDGVPT